MSKKQIWYNVETDFYGIVGADSFDEAAEIILEDENPDILDLVLDGKPVTHSNVRAGLDELEMRAIKVPSALMRQERWDESNIHPIDERDRPGRGYVKVFGFNP